MAIDYHRLSITEKRTVALSRAREDSVACPDCFTKVTAVDLLPHMRERCAGRPEPEPFAKWVTWREAIAMGVKARTLAWWAERGFVRFRGEKQDRKYLLKDLAIKISQQKGFRRR